MLGKVVRNHSMRHTGAPHTPVDQNAGGERGIEDFNRAGTINPGPTCNRCGAAPEIAAVLRWGVKLDLLHSCTCISTQAPGN